MSNFNIRSGNTHMPQDPIINFPYEPDNCQKHAFHAIEQGDDMLLCWPTGVGKTTPAIYAILHTIKKLKKRVVYTTPIKSLSNEKYNEFTKLFSKYNIKIGILTGDNKINPDADCILATAEILRNSLFQTNKDSEQSNYNLSGNFVNSIGCVIMDEIHYMNDEERGNVWESTIIRLNNNIQLIMLSGTVGNPNAFCKWVSHARSRNISLIMEPKRIVPLTHYLFVNKKIYEYMDENNVYLSQNYNKAEIEFKELKKFREKKLHKSFDDRTDIMNMVFHLKSNNEFPAIFFAFSRDKCNTYAHIVDDELKESLLSKEEQIQTNKLFQQYLGSKTKQYENLKEFFDMKSLLQKGIAYHHAYVIQDLRELIEILMKEKLIKILFATETLCIGVNVPAKTCIFTGLDKFTKSGKRTILSSEYRQMAGRAGRRGMDLFGLVYLLPLRDFPYESELKSVINTVNPNIRSNFKFDYQFVLKFSQIENFDLIDFFSRSLKNFENVEMEKSLQITYQKLCDEHSELETELNNSIVDENVKKILDFEKLIINKITLTKQQEKERKTLLNNMDPNSQKTYKLMTNKNNIQNKIVNVKLEIDACKNYINNLYNSYKNVLSDWEYTGLKAIICSQINDCNSILLTEIICEKYLIDLNPNEIIAFLSIFTESNQTEDCELDDNLNNVYNRIDDLEYLIQECEETEIKYISELHRTDYTINKNYIIVAYEWANGKTVHEMLIYFEKYNISTEAFRKNMIKINNIIMSIIGIYTMIKQDVELIPILQNASKLIMRDIVYVSSLYLVN